MGPKKKTQLGGYPCFFMNPWVTVGWSDRSPPERPGTWPWVSCTQTPSSGKGPPKTGELNKSYLKGLTWRRGSRGSQGHMGSTRIIWDKCGIGLGSWWISWEQIINHQGTIIIIKQINHKPYDYHKTIIIWYHNHHHYHKRNSNH